MGNRRSQEKNSNLLSDFYLVSELPIQIKSDMEIKCIMVGMFHYRTLQCFNFVDEFIKIFMNASLTTLARSRHCTIFSHHILSKNFSADPITHTLAVEAQSLSRQGVSKQF